MMTPFFIDRNTKKDWLDANDTASWILRSPGCRRRPEEINGPNEGLSREKAFFNDGQAQTSEAALEATRMKSKTGTKTTKMLEWKGLVYYPPAESPSAPISIGALFISFFLR
jgi:hypothetical protein